MQITTMVAAASAATGTLSQIAGILSEPLSLVVWGTAMIAFSLALRAVPRRHVAAPAASADTTRFAPVTVRAARIPVERAAMAMLPDVQQ